MKFVYIILVFFVLLIVGCTTKVEDLKSFSLPEWYLSKPINTNKKLYGVGSGLTLKESIANALNDISSTLLVSVKSSINKNTTLDDNNYHKKVIENINLQTNEITFSNYKIDKSLQLGDNIYTLIEVNKLSTYQRHMKKFTHINNQIKNIEINLNNLAALDKINYMRKIVPMIKKAKKIILILTSLNPEFNATMYYKKYRTLTVKLNNLKRNLMIHIESKNPNDEFTKYFIEFLTSNGYRSNNKNYSIRINLKSLNENSQVNGWYIVRVITMINIYQSNKLISSRIIKTLGRSSNSEDIAYSNAAKQFNKNITELGIEKILFGQ